MRSACGNSIDIDAFNEGARQNATLLSRELGVVPGISFPPAEANHNCHVDHPIAVDPDKRDGLRRYLLRQGIDGKITDMSDCSQLDAFRDRDAESIDRKVPTREAALLEICVYPVISTAKDKTNCPGSPGLGRPVSLTRNGMSQSLDAEAMQRRFYGMDEGAISRMVRDTLAQELSVVDGGLLEQFEESAAAFLGARHAVAVCNGTAAIHLALFAMDLQPGEQVLIPVNADDAAALPVLMSGGIPVFCALVRMISVSTWMTPTPCEPPAPGRSLFTSPSVSRRTQSACAHTPTSTVCS